MVSKSGGHDVRNRGRRGHRNLKGRALSASHINSLEKFADQNHRENGAGSAEKDCEIGNNVNIIQKAFGKGRQSDQLSRPAVDLISGAHVSKLLARNTSEKCQNSAACGKDGCRSRAKEEKDCAISFKLTSNGGLGGDLHQVEEAEKLAFLSDSCSKMPENFADQNSLEKEVFRETSPKRTSSGGRGKNTSLLKSLQVKIIAEKLAKNAADENNNVGIDNKVETLSMRDISFKPPHGGHGGQRDSQKEAEKLALLVDSDSCPNSSQKSADQNNNAGALKYGGGNENGENSLKEAKRGREGFLGKEERQPNHMQIEKVAEKLALLGGSHQNLQVKFADHNSNDTSRSNSLVEVELF